MSVFPSPSRIAVEHTDAVRHRTFCIFGEHKGERIVGVGDRNVSADYGCDLVVGDPSNKVKNGAWEVGVYAIPMVTAVKALIASYRFIKTNALFVRLAGLISTPRKFVCLRNNDSSFLKKLGQRVNVESVELGGVGSVCGECKTQKAIAMCAHTHLLQLRIGIGKRSTHIKELACALGLQ